MPPFIANIDEPNVCRDCEFLCHNYCFKLKCHLSIGQIVSCGCYIYDSGADRAKESENGGEFNA